MKNAEDYIRQCRAISIVHAEAFQLMLYKSDDGSEVWFWNSRDGVTPFGTYVDGKEYHHAIHGYATSFQTVLPSEAQYVWVSHDRSSWAQMNVEKYDRFSKADYPYYEEFKNRFPRLADWHASSPYEWGQPRQITRWEYLRSTPEFIGRLGLK